MSFELNSYIKKLKQKDLLPKNMEIAIWEKWFICSCFDFVSNQYISESVSMGIDFNKQTAIAKALTEFCERKIARSIKNSKVKVIERSDGFAAFPVIGYGRDKAQFSARENALNEATERFLWASWWDNENINYKISNLNNLDCYEKLQRDFNLISLSKIEVSPSNSDINLEIFLAKNKIGGYVTGGAAGNLTKITDTNSRAFGELLRHLLSVKNMLISSDNTEISFYEKRLRGFAAGKWSKLVEDRLSKKGNSIIRLPDLKLDCLISHEYQEDIVLHRCLYKDQPVFMGGKLERFCI